MYSRWIVLAASCAAVTTLSACGSTGNDASPPPSTSVVTVTTVVAAPSTTTEAPVVTEDPTTDETGAASATAPDPTTATQTIDRGTGASAYVGHYQRHASTMTLEPDQTGTLFEGASAADAENWAISWRPAAQGITITYQRLLKKYGTGLGAGLAPGRTFTARFTASANGKQLLSTSAIPPAIVAVGWCRSGDGGSPECGA